MPIKNGGVMVRYDKIIEENGGIFHGLLDHCISTICQHRDPWLARLSQGLPWHENRNLARKVYQKCTKSLLSSNFLEA